MEFSSTSGGKSVSGYFSAVIVNTEDISIPHISALRDMLSHTLKQYEGKIYHPAPQRERIAAFRPVHIIPYNMSCLPFSRVVERRPPIKFCAVM